VLSVSPAAEDRFQLHEILSSPGRTLYSEVAFALTAKRTLAAAASALRRNRISIVMCEYDMSPGSWRELLDVVGRLPAPLPVIVTSRIADERMWAEVLNLGGYDVLAKPFHSEEVIRTLTSAWSLWQHRFQCQTAERSQIAGGNAA
jgi:DNA-binding NtrC family response regulator